MSNDQVPAPRSRTAGTDSLETASPHAVPSADDRREHKRLSEHHFDRAQTLAAWLLASLVAVNSTAAAAIVATAAGEPRRPAIAFAAGIIAALVSGIISWAEALSNAGASFLRSKRRLSADERATLDRRTKLSEKLLEWAWSANLLSLFCFIAGCVWAMAAL